MASRDIANRINVVHDDKVERDQVASWRMHRKRMKRQSRIHAYHESMQNKIDRLNECMICTIAEIISQLISIYFTEFMQST